MIIGLNAIQFHRQNSGIGQYIKSLFAELVPRMLNNQMVDEIIIYITRDAPEFPGVADYPRVRLVRLPINRLAYIRRGLYEQTLLTLRIINDKVDLYLSADTKLPWIVPRRIKTVVILHDLCVFRWPEEYKGSRVLYWQRVFQRSLRRADQVIAVSNFSKDEAVDILRLAPEKIYVVHNGVEPRFHPINEFEQLMRVKKQYNLPENFILFVGQMSPRKNLASLFTAFRSLNKDFPGLNLVLVGMRGWKDQNTWDMLDRLGIKDKVYFPGYVDDEDLPAVYNLARITVYPSLYEGFGLPPLESMACGTICIASNTSSIPEVVMDCASLVEPQPEYIANEISRVLLLNSDDLNRYKQRGIERAASLSWARAAEETQKVILQAINKE